MLTGNSMQPLPGYEGVGFKVLAAYGGQLNLFGECTDNAISMLQGSNQVMLLQSAG